MEMLEAYDKFLVTVRLGVGDIRENHSRRDLGCDS